MPFFLPLFAIGFEFGSAPQATEFAHGQKIYHMNKGIDRAQGDARIVLGNWFDGERTQVVEELDFLTPGLLSRWLGYQEASGTPKDKIDSAWKNFSEQFKGKSMALVRLARLGAIDIVDGDLDDHAVISALDSVKLEMRTKKGEWQEVKYRVIQDLQARQPHEVLRDTWDQILAKFSAWPSTPTADDLISEIRWGNNRRVSFLAEVPQYEPHASCEIRIIEKDRTRTIPFYYPKS